MEPRRCLMGGLVLITDKTGLDKVTYVLSQCGAPEPLEEEVSCALGPGMAGELAGVGPRQDFRP